MELTIGLIGAGNIGQALAHHLSKAGYRVLISNSKNAETLTELAASLGGNVIASSFEQAAAAEVIIVSVPWKSLPDVASRMADWQNKIIIDTNNNILAVSPALLLDSIGPKTTGTYVAELFKGALVIKAFNTHYFKILEQAPDSGFGTRTMPVSGDNIEAKSIVKEIIENIGFKALDLGTLAEGGKLQEVGAALSSIDLFQASNLSASAIEVVRTNTLQVQGQGNFEIFDQLFDDEFIDHTPQPGFSNDKQSVKQLYAAIRKALPDFTPRIQWMFSDGDRVTTYKTYEGTHTGGVLFGIESTGKRVHFQTVDVMRVRNGRITDHWGIANLIDLVEQLKNNAV